MKTLKTLKDSTGKQPDFKVKRIAVEDSTVAVYVGKYENFKTWCVVSVDYYDKQQKTFSKHGEMFNTYAEANEHSKAVAASFNLNS